MKVAAKDPGDYLPLKLPVSVVIPAYNGTSFIGDAIDSVHAQSTPPAEIVVVDDGSTDDTGRIAESRGARVIWQENRGCQSALSTGIRSARFDWIAILNQDDLWLPEKLERQWEALSLCPGSSICVSDFSIFNETKTTVASFFTDEQKGKQYREVDRQRTSPCSVCCSYTSFVEQYLPGHFVLPSTLIARRDTLLQVGLFDSAFPIWGDYELVLRLLAASPGPVAVVDRPVMRYRVHAESMSHASDAKIQSLVDQIVMSERIFAQPTRYPNGSVEFFEKTSPQTLRAAGILSLQLGHREAAIRYLQRSIRARFALSTLGLLCGAAVLRVGGKPLDTLLRSALRFRYRNRARART